MRRSSIIGLLAAAVITLYLRSAVAETEKNAPKSTEPDSAYVDKGEGKPEEGGGGLLDFIPFFGGRSKKALPPEQLSPSPLPEASKPVLSKDDLDELREDANEWLTTSEITEPAVRVDENGKYYRDYVIFGSDYKIDVLRGTGKDKPFVANIYVQGDYFKTKTYDDSSQAKADFDFKYQPLEFRVVFERVEKWEYSPSPNDEPFKYTERWEFRKLQSRAKVNLPEQNPAPAQPAEKSDVTPQAPPQPAEEGDAPPQAPPQPPEKGDAAPPQPRSE